LQNFRRDPGEIAWRRIDASRDAADIAAEVLQRPDA